MYLYTCTNFQLLSWFLSKHRYIIGSITNRIRSSDWTLTYPLTNLQLLWSLFHNRRCTNCWVVWYTKNRMLHQSGCFLFVPHRSDSHETQPTHVKSKPKHTKTATPCLTDTLPWKWFLAWFALGINAKLPSVLLRWSTFSLPYLLRLFFFRGNWTNICSTFLYGFYWNGTLLCSYTHPESSSPIGSTTGACLRETVWSCLRKQLA